MACAAVQPRGAGRTVFVDAVPEAAAVEAQLEKQLELDGFRIVRGDEGADLSLRLDQRSAIDKAFAPLAPGTYTLTVVRGPLPGKSFTSMDRACRDVAQPPSECHADKLLRDLADSGELK